MNIHEALVHLRRKTGMTQREVSRKAEMASGSLSRIEQGNGLPSIPSLLRLLEVLDADLLDLAVAMKYAGRQPEARAHLMDEWQIPEGGNEAIADELRRDVQRVANASTAALADALQEINRIAGKVSALPKSKAAG